MMEVNTIEPLTALVPRILDDDTSALEELVDRALPKLIAAARRYGVMIHQDAEDIVHEVIFKTIIGLGELHFDRGGKDPLLNYLVKAVKNSAVDLHRTREKERKAIEAIGRDLKVTPRTRWRHGEGDEGEADDGEDVVDAGHPPNPQSPEVDAIKEFLIGLSHEDQVVLLLHAEGVLSSREIGELLGIQAAAVRQRVKRLHDDFRKEYSHVHQQ